MDRASSEIDASSMKGRSVSGTWLRMVAMMPSTRRDCVFRSRSASGSERSSEEGVRVAEVEESESRGEVALRAGF